MQLHTDLLTYADLYDASRIAHVDFLRNDKKGSRTRVRKFDFRLQGWTSNRYMNSGQFGAQVWDGNAATWDEWGIFLNVLFQRDPEAHTGSYGYLGLESFQHQTNHRFDALTHDDQHINHTWKSLRELEGRHARQCACGAIARYDQPEHLRLVKHGIVQPGVPATVDRWLTTTPVQRAIERELVLA